MNDKGWLPKGPLGWVVALAMILALYMAFVFAPTEATMGDVQRIFYFHMPSAWAAFLAFGVVFVASIQWLRTKQPKWDAMAVSATEVGILFCTIALFTGSIWAKPIWGTWWDWDPRLTTTLILWLIYISYLMLRTTVENPGQASVPVGGGRDRWFCRRAAGIHVDTMVADHTSGVAHRRWLRHGAIHGCDPDGLSGGVHAAVRPPVATENRA